MKKMLLGCCLLTVNITYSQNVGIGTTTPNTYGKLHVHDNASTDVSISLTNGITTDAILRGARFRMLNNDLNIINYEATGKLNLVTGINTRMTIDNAGYVGIGTTTPTYLFHVVDPIASAIATIQSTNGDRAELKLMAGNNIFNDLFIQKYYPGTPGTFGGIPKDNLSVISTGGNGGSLLLGAGDGVSPLIFVTGTGERMRVEGNGQVAIGTSTPATAGKLHIHDDIANQDVSIVMTNNLTGPGNLRGMRLRLLNSDVTLINYEATGKLNFSTGFNVRMSIDNAGNVGIGTLTPANPLHIVSSGSTDGLRIEHSGANVKGIFATVSGVSNTEGLFGFSSHNSDGTNNSAGVHGVSGTGGIMFTSISNYGVIGENLNTVRGSGVIGASNASSASLSDAGVFGVNWNTGADSYGVIGSSSGTSGAGVAGTTFNAGAAAILGYTQINNATAIRAEIPAGGTGTALELKNGSLKVSGASKPVFQITTSAGNISGNLVNIPLSTQANVSTDMLVVTPVFTGTYLNKPIGVWWNGANWTIFTQDSSPMPAGVVFNVLVVKQ